MEAQRLRHRVTFERPVVLQDEFDGAGEEAWTSDATMINIPAEVLTGPGKEPITAEAKFSVMACRINVRWFPGLNQTWRVIYDGITYDLIQISTDRTGRREWRLICDSLGDGT